VKGSADDHTPPPPPAAIIITGHCNSDGGLVISSAVAQGASSDLICYHTVEISNEFYPIILKSIGKFIFCFFKRASILPLYWSLQFSTVK